MAPLENDISAARDNNLDTAASAKGEMKTSQPPTDVSRMKTVPPTKLAPTATTSSATSQVKTTPPAAENKKEKVEKTTMKTKKEKGPVGATMPGSERDFALIKEQLAAMKEVVEGIARS